MRRIRLFTTAFPEGDPARRAEFAECLLRNIACPELDEVCVLVEGEVALPQSAKLVRRRTGKRPQYADYFRWIDEVSGQDDISIIANADIYFDRQIGVLRVWNIPDRTALAMSRWEIAADGSAMLNDRNDSQDVWVFRGTPSGIKADYPIGVPRCDNRFTKELELAGYSVRNPSFSVRSFHLHGGHPGEYTVEQQREFVEGPYGYVWPHNLMPLPRVLWHNARNRDYRLEWRLDKRHWRRVLKFHWASRVLRVLMGERP